MTAITKPFTVVADPAVDPDSPLTTTLLTALRDRDQFLLEWLGASFSGAAVQDHNHDGVGSALIPIGPNRVRNGSFESDVSGWTITQYTGGTVARNTSNRQHGAACLAFTSTVLANGGGDAVQAEFMPVAGGSSYPFEAWAWASVANVSFQFNVIWYDNAQSQISLVGVVGSTNTPITATRFGADMTAPANARFARIQFVGAVPSLGAATGTVFLDGIVASDDQNAVSATKLATARLLNGTPFDGTSNVNFTATPADMGYGSVGSFCLAFQGGGVNTGSAGLLAGSNLNASDTAGTIGAALSGTWRNVSGPSTTGVTTTVWERIS